MNNDFIEKAHVSQRIKLAISSSIKTLDEPLDHSLQLEGLDVIAYKLADLIISDFKNTEVWSDIADYAKFIHVSI